MFVSYDVSPEEWREKEVHALYKYSFFVHIFYVCLSCGSGMATQRCFFSHETDHSTASHICNAVSRDPT